MFFGRTVRVEQRAEGDWSYVRLADPEHPEAPRGGCRVSIDGALYRLMATRPRTEFVIAPSRVPWDDIGKKQITFRRGRLSRFDRLALWFDEWYTNRG